MFVKKSSLLFAMMFVLLLTACGGKAPETVNEERSNEKDGQQTVGSNHVFPLTGLPTDQEPKGRAISVVVNNHPEARPQSGLTKADIVYETLAEGSVTRLLAIYQSEQPENIGPIRSARDYFIDLAQGYDSLFIAHGYSPEAKAILSSGKIDHLNGIQHDGTLFKRVDFRQAPHNSYITFERIEEGAQAENYNMNTLPDKLDFKTEEDQQLQGNQLSYTKIAYSKKPDYVVEYTYDADQSKYNRSVAGEQTVELNTNEPVLLDNILIIETNHEILDSEGRQDIDLNSGGKGFLLQKGFLKEIEWKSVDGRLLPFEEGKPVPFVPGKTWINIVPSLSIVTLEE